jgi:hypothetical protein
MKRLLMIACLLLPVLACAQRALVVQGVSLGGVDLRAMAGMAFVAARDLPADAAALAARTPVLVCKPETLSPAQQAAVEAFVRGGGGLLIDGAGDRTRWRGGVLDVMSPAFATYDARVALAQPRVADAPAGLDLTAFPRIGAAFNAATPDRAPVSYLNLLSAWYFDKPLWHRDAQPWLTADDPAATPILAVARYGAGRVAIASWTAIADGKAPALQQTVAHTLRWLDGGAWQAPVALPLTVRGYALPAWYAKPLGDGLRGMGEKLTPADYTRPPEALWEAGFTLTDGAPTLALFGAEADAPAPAGAVVLRAPDGTPAVQTAFDAGALPVTAAVKTAVLNGAPVALPHRVPPFAKVLPTLDVPAWKPAVTLPDTWRMAFTHDTDTDRDVKEAWQAPGFNDAAWTPGKIGAQKMTVFGESLGYDGAIWYRGVIEVTPAAAMPNAALRVEARDTRGTVTVFVDGTPVALELRVAVVPLTAVGAGKHLLAVRVYGELRTNTGLTSLDARYLPLLWKADPTGAGWTDGWYRPETPVTDWQPVSGNFVEEPAGKGPMEGWARLVVNVPADAAPFQALLTLHLNMEAVVFVNGTRVGANAPARINQHRLPAARFTPGKNVVAVWARYSDRQARGFDLLCRLHRWSIPPR